MKNLLMLLFSTMFLMTQACTNGKTENTEAENTAKTEVAKPAKAEENKGGVITLSKQDFLTKVWNYESTPDKWVYNGDKPSIIDFYADWCRPCKIAGPILEELAIEYKDDIYVYKIDTEKERELAAAFGIQSIPAFLLIPQDGQPQMSAGIARTPEETKEMFRKIIEEFLLKKQ